MGCWLMALSRPFITQLPFRLCLASTAGGGEGADQCGQTPENTI